MGVKKEKKRKEKTNKLKYKLNDNDELMQHCHISLRSHQLRSKFVQKFPFKLTFDPIESNRNFANLLQNGSCFLNNLKKKSGKENIGLDKYSKKRRRKKHKGKLLFFADF